jgi:predicted RNA binding protein YcfA (HicA-like mRNA interferase family)
MDFKHLVRALRQQGWRLEHTNNGHLKLIPPNGTGVVVMTGNHKTADPRAIRNTVSLLRQRGFSYP